MDFIRFVPGHELIRPDLTSLVEIAVVKVEDAEIFTEWFGPVASLPLGQVKTDPAMRSEM